MSAPPISAPPISAPPARKKYTLAEVFGEDDDDDDEGENNEDVAAAAVAAGRQDFGQPPVPGKPLPLHRLINDNRSM